MALQQSQLHDGFQSMYAIALVEAVKIVVQSKSIGNRPNTVSKSTVSNTKRSYRALGRNSVSSVQPIICVSKRTRRVFFPELTEFGAELSESSRHYSRDSILRVSKYVKKLSSPPGVGLR